MTSATRAIREQGFEPVECDIPPELTIAEYRSRRRERPRERRRSTRVRISLLLRR